MSERALEIRVRKATESKAAKIISDLSCERMTLQRDKCYNKDISFSVIKAIFSGFEVQSGLQYVGEIKFLLVSDLL